MKLKPLLYAVSAFTLVAFYFTEVKAQQKVFYIETKDKIKKANYYFMVMDSIALISNEDTIRICPNCINFMEEATGIYASGKVTAFGQLDFTRQDILKWHLWFERKELKK